MRLWIAGILLPLLALADDTTGAVRGVVSDQTKAAVPNAQVELVNADTGLLLRQKTSTEGQFTFTAVKPGRYSMRAAIEGFQTHTLSGIVVEVNRTTQVDITLAVGAVTQSMEVKSAALTLDTASAQVSLNADEKLITGLPTSSRNSLGFAEMAPGVTLIRPGSQVQGNEGGTANVNGLRRSANVFYMDGSDNTGSFRNTALQFPNPEAVQEVQVSTSSNSAEFGKQPGGIFNVLTKSGTNELHGSGFLFFHNEALNANSWTQNRSGVNRSLDRVQQFGGTVGGPVRRNRTFYFASYQRYRDFSTGFQNTKQMPTPAILKGDFSAFARPLYDPDTGAALPGNQVPARLLDPVATKFAAELFPTVPVLGQRLAWNYRDSTDNNELLLKGDHSFNDRHMIMVSWLKTFGTVSANTGNGNNLPAWAPRVDDSHQDTVSARYTWIATASTVLQARFATALHVANNRNVNVGRTLEDFGAKWPIGQEGATRYLPQLTVSDGFVANLGAVNYFEQGNYRTGATLTWLRAGHNLKVGGETQRETVTQNLNFDRSNFTFDGRSASKSTGVGVFGYSMADFLMGRAATFTQNGVRNYNVFNWSHFFFLQDEWRITRRLTLSPGLRYEFYSPSREANGRASSYVAGHKSDLYPNAPLGIAFQGDRGVPQGFFPQDHNNFAPRMGVAWDPFGDGKTAVRAGFGFYYSYQYIGVAMWNSERTPWDPQAAGGNTRSLVDPWGTSQAVVYTKPPTPFRPSPNDFAYPAKTTNMLAYDLPMRTPYTLQWNLSVQRQLVKSVAAQVSYVGNRGFNFDQILEANLPVFTTAATLANLESRRPIANFGNIELVSNRARSWYDALQVAVDLRVRSSFQSKLAYTFQKSLAYSEEARGQGFAKPANPFNLDAEKAISAPQQVLRYFWLWDLPVFRHVSGWRGRALGGWQLSGDFTAQSGSPLDVLLGSDWNYDGLAGDRPNVTGPIRYTSGSADARMARFFDTGSFVSPAVHNTFGNLSRNALFGPGLIGADLGLAKRFRWTDRRFLQLRMEAYNWANHANLDAPNTTANSVDFGKVLTRSGSRTMQASLRLVF